LDLLLAPVIATALLLPAAWFWRRHDPIEALALGAAAGVVLWGALGLARFFFVLPPGRAQTVGVVALLASFAGGLALSRLARDRSRQRSAAVAAPGLLRVMVGIALLTLGLQASLPHYDLAGRFYDWYLHFDLARFYQTATDLGRQYADGTVTTRTPLFNLLGSVALSALGDRFTVFQVLTAVVGWFWVFPFALLARRLVPRSAVAAVALAGISPLILHAHAYTWPKGQVAFLVLLALERLLVLLDAPPGRGGLLSLQVGALGGAAVMTHPGFVGYALALVAAMAWAAATGRRRWREPGLAALAGILVVLPWYAWAVAQYGWAGTFFSYPRTPYASLWHWAVDRMVIVATTVFPFNLPFNPLSGRAAALEDYFIVYLGTAVGMLGVALLVRTLAQHLRPWSRMLAAPAAWPVLLFAAGGLLTGAVLLDGLVEYDAASFGIPALLGLLLLAVRVNPLSRFWAGIAVLEAVLLQAVLLAWVRSPSSAGQNALLAARHGIRFLGADTWPQGLVLALAGAGICIGAVAAHRYERSQPSASARSRARARLAWRRGTS